MAGITLEQAQAKLNEYLAAETAVLSGQAYEIAGRSLRRADLEMIQAGIAIWNTRVISLNSLNDPSVVVSRTVIMRPR